MVITFTSADRRNAGFTVRVKTGIPVDVQERLSRFQATETSAEDGITGLYARATYLKYRSAMQEFSSVAATFSEWATIRARAKNTAKEMLLLLEAYLEAPEEKEETQVGALLLRSAWNFDVVIDFLFAREMRFGPGMEPVTGAGTMMCYSALAIAKVSNASRVLVETAAHSRDFWSQYFKQGTDLWRFDRVEIALQRASNKIINKHWLPKIEYVNA